MGASIAWEAPVPETRVPIITLTTDFGISDHYVSQIKGVILSQISQVNLVDVSHDIPAHDIVSAAFTIRATCHVFPPRTVHLVVVDPGVGTERRPIAVASSNHYFVGPDNGVFTLVYESDPNCRVYHITADHYFRENPSPTFHGRDIFAPVAGQLARGIGVENFGDPIEDPVKIDLPRPKVTGEGRVSATIIQVDRFGNLVTNVTQSALNALLQKTGKSRVKGSGNLAAVTETRKTYGEGAAGTPFFLFNSNNHLEIASRDARASEILQIEAGDRVEVDLA
jgi:S-adenosylmethionine hydrolase